jgi:endonuclease YncB( thermonuclease family)
MPLPRTIRIPPPPRGMPGRMRLWYVVVAAAISTVMAAVPMCPVPDRQGRPTWRVETIHDGDTVTCIDLEGRPQKIRLLGIDAPEYDQPFGRESRATLDRKLVGRRVRVEGRARDQHGRLLGTLWIDDRDINREMVLDGQAWVFGGFAPDEELLAAEADARKGRRGLWSDSRPVSPAEWRSAHPSHR